jgi:hypothetical protein
VIPDIEKFLLVAIFKMATTIPHKFNIVRFQRPELIPNIEKISTGCHFQNGGRNFSMSGIISGHHNLPTYEMSLKSDNVECVRYCGGHFENCDR